jgi:hypothetical protein
LSTKLKDSIPAAEKHFERAGKRFEAVVEMANADTQEDGKMGRKWWVEGGIISLSVMGKTFISHKSRAKTTFLKVRIIINTKYYIYCDLQNEYEYKYKPVQPPPRLRKLCSPRSMRSLRRTKNSPPSRLTPTISSPKSVWTWTFHTIRKHY